MGVGFERVAGNVYCMVLPHPVLQANNVYLVLDEKPALIDGGHFFAGAQEILARALNDMGLSRETLAAGFLTDATPDRVGFWLDSAKSALGAHPDAVAAADYGSYSLYYRRDVVAAVFEDRQLFSRMSLRDLDETLKACFRAAGRLNVPHRLEEGRAIPLGKSTLHPVFTPGPSGTHVAYLLEPEGILFSGDYGGAEGVEIPALYCGQGGGYRKYLSSLNRLSLLECAALLPANGKAYANPFEAQATLSRARKAAEQIRENVRGLLSGGPRTMASLLDFLALGHGLSPVRMLQRAATLRAVVNELVDAGEAEELYEDGIFHFRLGPKAVRPVRRAA